MVRCSVVSCHSAWSVSFHEMWYRVRWIVGVAYNLDPAQNNRTLQSNTSHLSSSAHSALLTSCYLTASHCPLPSCLHSFQQLSVFRITFALLASLNPYCCALPDTEVYAIKVNDCRVYNGLVITKRKFDLPLYAIRIWEDNLYIIPYSVFCMQAHLWGQRRVCWKDREMNVSNKASRYCLYS